MLYVNFIASSSKNFQSYSPLQVGQESIHTISKKADPLHFQTTSTNLAKYQ